MKRILLAATILVLATILGRAWAGVESGRTHTYFISADQLTWSYVPSGIDHVTGKPFHSVGLFAVPNGNPVIKPVRSAYVKCLYREYTDGTFRTLKSRPPQWQHLGMLGPLMRAEVGDTIRVVYRNNCTFPNSIHVHGLQYAKNSEGAPYDDGTPGGVKPGDSVQPGHQYTYVWHVPDRAGPAANDPSSIMWMYHSHTNDYRDFNSGLVGPIIITARGQARPDGTPKGVDREFVVWFSQIHEEDSWYVKRNLPTVDADHAIPIGVTDASATVEYPYFVRFSINGFSFSNMPLRAMTMHMGERVRWYVMDGENDFDFHTPHWHGNTVVIGGMRTDVASLAPMQMLVAEMRPDSPGIWMLHCHVAFHNDNGMNTRYVVTR